MWIVLGILALPLVEIGLFVTLGAQLGLWLTLAWVLLTGVAGVLLLKGLALSGQRGLRDGLQEGLHDPLSPLAHKALMGVAAVLLILPGFFTDALGLLLLLPPVRSWLGAKLPIATFSAGRPAPRRYETVIDGEAVEVVGEILPPEPPPRRDADSR